MTQTIEQLQARVAELEAENARLKTVPMKYRRMQFNAQLQDENAALRQQLAAAQADNKRLRDALDRCRSGAAALGIDRIFEIGTEALAQPSDTSALDAYVAEKVSAQKLMVDVISKQVSEFSDLLDKKITTLTRQRDLAVEALRRIAKTSSSPMSRTYAEQALATLKESEKPNG